MDSSEVTPFEYVGRGAFFLGTLKEENGARSGFGVRTWDRDGAGCLFYRIGFIFGMGLGLVGC